MAIDFVLNGLEQSVDVDPEAPLIYILRNDLQLHGAKLGCGLEQCGACLVLLDDKPTYACTTHVADIEGRSLRTIEGLADDDGVLDPLQQAFIELNAAQCGYCMAGIVMRAKHLLEANAHPSRKQICEALDGHLCRCGAHPRIVAAIERAVAIVQARGM